MPDEYSDLIRGVVGSDPAERVRKIARQSQISPDIAEDYLKTTQVESGHNINVRNSSKGAMGFGQVMPDRPGGTIRTVGGQQYNLRNPDENITAGLKYFAEGGNDPVSRRLYYFGGPRAKAHYEKTGQIPNISDGNMTAAQYVRATGGQRPRQTPTPDPYDDLIRSVVNEPAQQAQPQSPVSKSAVGLIPGITQLRQVANPKVRARAKVQPQIQVGGEVGQPSEGTQARAGLRGLAEMAGSPTQLLGNTAGDFINQTVAQGAAGLTERAAGLVNAIPRDPFSRNQPIESAVGGLRQGARNIRQASAAIDKETVRPKVHIPIVGDVSTKDVQNLGSSAIETAPALILTRLGVPAPVAFGLDSYLASSGRGEDLQTILKETGVGAATGGLYEIPLPAKMNLLSQIGAKLGIGAVGGYGIAKAAGMPEEEARKNSALTALFMASGVKGREAPKTESLTQVPEPPQREASPYLQPQDVAKRIALREQGTVPPATLPEVPDAVRNMTSQPIGPRRLPTPRGTERPVVPSENLSEQIGVGIQSDTGDIAVANAKIAALQRRIQETQAVKQPSPRVKAMQERLQQQLADATHERNLLLDPKVQAQLENKPIRQVFAERRAARPGTVEPEQPAQVPEVPAQSVSPSVQPPLEAPTLLIRGPRTTPIPEGNEPAFFRAGKRVVNKDGQLVMEDRPQVGEPVSHPNPEIDGKPVIAQTQDGRVIVPNEGNKSGVSVVKHQVSQPAAEVTTPQSASTPQVAVTPPTPTAEPLTGIAHRVETQVRGEEPVRGESIGAEESVQRGRDLLTKSPDPGRLVAQTVTAFDKTGAVSPESMAIVRAQHEQLAQSANRAFDANGINSPEFKAAEQARRDFYDNAVKPMQTAWSNTGRAQQGATEIDTGTFYGLFRAFRDTNGREMNPREQLTAKKLSDTSAAADLRLSETQKTLVDTLNKICPP